MSQNDFTLANQGFPSMRADMNSAFQALASNNSGGTAPATTFAHQLWYDTSANLLMIRNSSNTAFEEFSSGGGVVYTEHSSNYTAVAGEGILADTTSNTWTLTLPASPSGGDVVIVSDAGDWSVNNLTVARNGSTINGNAENLVLDIGKISVTLVYAFNDWQVFTQMGANGGLVVTETGTQTLTNKTIDASQLTGDIDASQLTGPIEINSSGNVGIGRDDPGTKVDVYTGTDNLYGIRLRSDLSGAQPFANFSQGLNTIGSIRGSTTSTSYNTSSDYRLKTDAQPILGATERVQALNPVNFEWLLNGTRVDGFLAHEAQEVVPEAVTGERDEIDSNGEPLYQAIDQSKLVPLLTAALREALTEISSLTAAAQDTLTEISSLKSRVEALEG